MGLLLHFKNNALEIKLVKLFFVGDDEMTISWKVGHKIN